MPHPLPTTPEELADTLVWFKSHMAELPQELEILPGVVARDLPTTVQKYLELAERIAGNNTYFGQLSHLVAIRRKIEGRQGGTDAR